MKQSSRRKKGKLLQNLVREKILKTFRPHLKKKDVDVASTGETGPDIKLSRIAKRLVPYSFETKNKLFFLSRFSEEFIDSLMLVCI